MRKSIPMRCVLVWLVLGSLAFAENHSTGPDPVANREEDRLKAWCDQNIQALRFWNNPEIVSDAKVAEVKKSLAEVLRRDTGATGALGKTSVNVDPFSDPPRVKSIITFHGDKTVLIEPNSGRKEIYDAKKVDGEIEKSKQKVGGTFSFETADGKNVRFRFTYAERARKDGKDFPWSERSFFATDVIADPTGLATADRIPCVIIDQDRGGGLTYAGSAPDGTKVRITIRQGNIIESISYGEQNVTKSVKLTPSAVPTFELDKADTSFGK